MALRKHILVFLIFLLEYFISSRQMLITQYIVSETKERHANLKTLVSTAFIKIQMDSSGSVRGLPLNE